MQKHNGLIQRHCLQMKTVLQTHITVRIRPEKMKNTILCELQNKRSRSCSLFLHLSFNLQMQKPVGYDPSEPPDSPYRFGNGSVMAEMEKITYEKAVELTGGNA